MEGNILKSNVALCIFQLQSIRRIFDVGMDFQYFKKSGISGSSVLELFGKADQFLDGLRKVVDVKQKGDQVGDRDQVFCDKNSTGGNDNHADQGGKCA